MEVDHIYLSNLQIGDKFEEIYYLENFFEKTAKSGKKYSDVIIRDKSGSKTARFWGVVDMANKNSFINVTGLVEEYLNAPQIVLNTITKQPDIFNFDKSHFIDTSATLEKDLITLDKVIKLIEEYSQKSNSEVCNQVIQIAFNESFKQEFIKASYGTAASYGYIGGLLAHTIKVCTLANEISKMYQLTILEKNILLTAALIHSAGSVVGYEIKGVMPAETLAGTLLGKTNLSLILLERILQKVQKPDDQSDIIANRIRHAVAVCGYNVIKPVTKEAIVLYEAYKTDYNLIEAFDYIKQDTNTGEFTAYDSGSKRKFYKG